MTVENTPTPAELARNNLEVADELLADSGIKLPVLVTWLRDDLRAVLAERDALAASLAEFAPHADACAKNHPWWDNMRPCSCWKSKTPVNLLAARDARVLRDAADDYRRGHPPENWYETDRWLHNRADRIEREA